MPQRLCPLGGSFHWFTSWIATIGIFICAISKWNIQPYRLGRYHITMVINQLWSLGWSSRTWESTSFALSWIFIFDLWGKVFKPLIFRSQLSTAELLFIGGEGDFQHQAAGKLRSQRDRCGWKRWASKLLDGSFGVPNCVENKGLTVTPKNEQRVDT